MLKLLPLLFLFTLACQRPKQPSDLRQITRDYYQAMTNSDFDQLSPLFFDSVRVTDGAYSMTYSLDNFAEWVAWDSIFSPEYEIGEIDLESGLTEVVVTKKCRRTSFLHEGPVVTRERLRFKEHKVYSLEILEYISFNNERWDTKRTQLLEWVEQHHPELPDFIHDQTSRGGRNYLKALELYESENSSEGWK